MDEATNPQSSSYHSGMQVRLGDGSVRFVTLARVLPQYPIAGVPVLDSFWHEAAQELQLGALREDWESLPGVSQPPTVPEGVVIFSYDGLATATRLLVDSPLLERHMVRLLRRAKEADAAGQIAAQDRFMSAYSTLAHDGTSSTAPLRGAVPPADHGQGDQGLGDSGPVSIASTIGTWEMKRG